MTNFWIPFSKAKTSIASQLITANRMNLPPKKSIWRCTQEGIYMNVDLWLTTTFAFLGASPDAKLCDNGQSGLMEIKCPYSARHMTVAEACESVKGFFIEKLHGEMKLKRSHTYYMQVQGQLMITGCDFCEFVVYTKTDLYTGRITSDIPFTSEILVKLANFFKLYGMPYFQRKHLQTEI